MLYPGMSVEADFLNWFTGNGAWISPKLAFKDYSEESAGRGMVALESFSKDEVLFKIPRRLLLSHKTTAHKTDVLKNAAKTGWSRIMWSIVLERLSENSLWKPYLDIVPAKFNLPISWSEQDKSFLSGTGVLEMIGEPEEDFRQNFAKVAKKIPLIKDLSLDRLRELYFYAGSFVSSYSFMEEDGCIVMVPMADMLNHRTGYNNARLFFEKDELQMICVKDVKAGEQLYNTYGDLGNAELLFKYGYMDDPNPFSVLEVHVADFMEFAESHQCPLHSSGQFKPAVLEKLLEKGSIPEIIELGVEPKISSDLLKWFQKAYKSDKQAAQDLKSCVVALLKTRLEQFCTSQPVNCNQKLAMRLADEQKQIIHRYIQFIESL